MQRIQLSDHTKHNKALSPIIGGSALRFFKGDNLLDVEHIIDVLYDT